MGIPHLNRIVGGGGGGGERGGEGLNTKTTEKNIFQFF